MAAVVAAIQTAGSGALTGAASEAGRRAWESLAGLSRRAARRDPRPDPDDSAEPRGTAEPDAHPGEDAQPSAPHGAQEHRELAAALLSRAAADPDFAGELARWLREVEGLRRAAHAPAPRAGGPRLLPAAPAHFTDRHDQLGRITAQLDAAGPRIAVISGTGGIGKTAAALHWAHTVRPRFPDGQLYVDLRGDSAASALAPSDVLVRFLHRLGVRPRDVPADLEAQAELFRDRTAELRVLVLLDNAHSTAQLTPLLTASPAGFTLVTSRRPLPELVGRYGAGTIRLGPLTPEDSERLMVRIVGEESFARQRRHAESVVRRCAGVPLALCTTGARAGVAEDPDWDRLDREFADWERARHQEDRMGNDPADRTSPRPAAPDRSGSAPAEPAAGTAGEGAGPDPAGRAEAAADLAYRGLSPRAARVHRLLGLCPWPSVPLGAVAALAGEEPSAVRPLLRELTAVRLLEDTGEERYHRHDLIRGHAARQAAQEPGGAAAVRRAVLWYLRLAAEHDARVIPGRWHLGPVYEQITGSAPTDPAQALEVLRQERQNLAEAVRAAEDRGFDDLVWQLCEAMWGFHLRLGFPELWAATHRRGVAAAQRCGDRRAEGRMRTQLAFALMSLGRHQDAERELRAAAAADRAAGHLRGEATAVESLGLLRLRLWRWDEAAELFGTARDLLERIGPGQEGARDVPRATALLEHHIGRALRGGSRYEEAYERLRRARVAFAGLPERDRYNEARVLMSLAETQLADQRPADAGGTLEEALTMLAAEGAALQRADAAELGARCARETGDLAGARRLLDLARSLHLDLGDAGAVARVDSLREELAAD
ncbi:tetratricopeptide repeat protein [Streptomyces palmae]|uniref:Tetratricopeptide repeat protein n=2 Tax=Streptomyces palmae TaxID=1701085 RepID=A0A4Z0HDD3_9ACTN|nr:tetratricopeptide repeat protein [Streptomyces palmae]